MVQKKSSSKKAGSIKDVVANIVFASLKEFLTNFIGDLQKAIQKTTKKMIETFLTMVIMLVGILMVLLGLPFLLSVYFGQSPSFFFVIIGLVLIVWSLNSFNNLKRS